MYQETTTLFDSASANFVYNNGASFDVNMDSYPMTFPAGAKNPCIYVNSARVWWTMPNLPDTFFNYSTAGGSFAAPIPKGLYDLPLLSQAIYNGINEIGNDPTAFTFTANLATQKVMITFNDSGLQIDFTNSPIAELMGFNPGTYPSIPSSTGQMVTGQNPANFNTISSFLIKMSGIRKGIPVNNSASGIIAEVLINRSPGSQINFEPINPITIPVGSEFLNGGLSTLSFNLTDNNGNLVDTNNETWSFKLTQRWS